MRSDQVGRLDAAIRAAGVPISGVAVVDEPFSVRVDFLPEATPQQQSQAQTIVDGFDWRDRRPRAYADLMNQIAALSAADRSKLLNAVAADFLRRHPKFAAQFGLALEGDEPVP